ncbi:hypothetical protein ACU4GD_21170 [Cupriavidus basilensis]
MLEGVSARRAAGGHPRSRAVASRYQEWPAVDKLAQLADLQNHGALIVATTCLTSPAILPGSKPVLHLRWRGRGQGRAGQSRRRPAPPAAVGSQPLHRARHDGGPRHAGHDRFLHRHAFPGQAGRGAGQDRRPARGRTHPQRNKPRADAAPIPTSHW